MGLGTWSFFVCLFGQHAPFLGPHPGLWLTHAFVHLFLPDF